MPLGIQIGPSLVNHRKAGVLSLSQAIASVGLTTGLKLALDAGDSASYSSGQKWLDRSGNGYDFFLGADGNAGASDPTFTGTAGGLSSGEYWSFNGSQYLTYDTTNETWMQNLHKDNAKGWGAAWIWIGAAQAQGIFGNSAGSSSNIGFVWQCNPSIEHSILVVNGSGSGSVINLGIGSAALSTGVWHFVAFSIDESVGANGLTLITDGNTQLRTSTYNTPSASDASFTSQIGTRGNANSVLSNGSRIAMLCMGEGVAPTAAQLLALRAATRGRFGV